VVPPYDPPTRTTAQWLQGLDTPGEDLKTELSKTIPDNTVSRAPSELARMLRSIRERAGADRWPLAQLGRAAFPEPPHGPLHDAYRKVIITRWLTGPYPPRRFDALARLLIALGATKWEQAQIETLLGHPLPILDSAPAAATAAGARQGVITTLRGGRGTIIDEAGGTYQCKKGLDDRYSLGDWVTFTAQTPPGGRTVAINVRTVRMRFAEERDDDTLELMKAIPVNLATRRNDSAAENERVVVSSLLVGILFVVVLILVLMRL
jgi:hypothetical protein